MFNFSKGRQIQVQSVPVKAGNPLWKRLVSLFLYGAVIWFIVVFKDQILLWLDQARDVSPLLIVLAATLLALFPVIPYPLIGGILGVTFGPELGAVYTWLGSASASILMFVLVRWLFFEWGQRLLQKAKLIDRITAWFERNAFLFILSSRLLPFIPSIVINVYCALSKVRFWPYAIASSLGKVPAMLLFAVLGDQLITEPRNMMITLSIYGLFILLVYLGYVKVYLRFSSR